MPPRPYLLVAAVLLVAGAFALTGRTFLAIVFVGMALGFGMWALGMQRASRGLRWVGVGITGIGVVVVSRAVFF